VEVSDKSFRLASMVESKPDSSSAPLGLTTPGLRKNGTLVLNAHDIYADPANTGHLGKQWHAQKTAFRPKAGQTSYEKRTAERKAMTAMKAKEKGMKDEKENERQVHMLCSMDLIRLLIPFCHSDVYRPSKINA